jgi:hypothetical protein
MDSAAVRPEFNTARQYAYGFLLHVRIVERRLPGIQY